MLQKALTIVRLVCSAMILGCAGDHASQPGAPSGSNPCEAYTDAVADAKRTQGDAQAEIRNSCGCPSTIQTSAEKAAAVRDAYPEWDGARCWVNCDHPCPPAQ